MAAIESKRSERKKAISNQQLAISQSKTLTLTQTKPTVRTRRRRFPRLPKPIVSRHGKTTTTRYPHGRTFYRFEEVKGKSVDFVQFFTMGEQHSIDVRFQDKTTLHFVIEPGFTLETEYSSLKSGNWRCIKKWPLIRSTPFNA
jgi:hypothetical protein